MDEIKIKNLSVINNEKGDILKGFLKSGNKAIEVNEVYFTEINPSEIKAWKRHKSMTCNLIAVRGKIKIVIQKRDKNFLTQILSKENYKMITIPPNFWFGFQCLTEEIGLLVNISNEEHNDDEAEQIDINELTFDWN
mgnify:FL=1